MADKIWMDVDTGVDDAAAIMAADAEPSLELVGLSAVAGNSSLENTFRNTRALNRVMGTSYPVYPGADRPLLRQGLTAPRVHGENGLGDVEPKLPENETVYTEKAWDALYRAACENEGLYLIATAPLTNIAIAFKRYPDLPGRLKRVFLMGGAAVGGNITPSAEFNIYNDPDAASIVFSSGADIVMCGLDVTNQVYLTEEQLEELAASETERALFLNEIVKTGLAFGKAWGYPGFVLHDLCPVFCLAHPEWFSGIRAGVAVETRALLSRGKTVTDLMSDTKFGFQNAELMLAADREAITARFMELLGGR